MIPSHAIHFFLQGLELAFHALQSFVNRFHRSVRFVNHSRQLLLGSMTHCLLSMKLFQTTTNFTSQIVEASLA